MGHTMDVETALAEAKEQIAALRREKEQRKSEAYPTSQQEESSDQYKAMQNIGFALEMTDPERFILASGRNPDAYKMLEARDIARRSKGVDMAALKTSLESDWDLSEAASKAEFDRILLLTGRNPDAYKRQTGIDPFKSRLPRGRKPTDEEWAEMDPYKRHEGREAGIIDREGRPKTEPAFTRRIGQPSAGRSAVLGEYRADPAWEAGFQSVLMNRDSYSLADLEGSGLRADVARDKALVPVGHPEIYGQTSSYRDAVGELGRSEALEFLEREAKKVERQSLIEGMQ